MYEKCKVIIFLRLGLQFSQLVPLPPLVLDAIKYQVAGRWIVKVQTKKEDEPQFANYYLRQAVNKR